MKNMRYNLLIINIRCSLGMAFMYLSIFNLLFSLKNQILCKIYPLVNMHIKMHKILNKSNRSK